MLAQGLLVNFEQASEGLIDPSLIFKVVILRFPDFVTLLLPLSFFLGVVITISRLYSDREIYGYFAGGLSNNDLIRYLLPQSIVFFFITLSLSVYIALIRKNYPKRFLLKTQFKSSLNQSDQMNYFLLMKMKDLFISKTKKVIF